MYTKLDLIYAAALNISSTLLVEFDEEMIDELYGCMPTKYSIKELEGPTNKKFENELQFAVSSWLLTSQKFRRSN